MQSWATRISLQVLLLISNAIVSRTAFAEHGSARELHVKAHTNGVLEYYGNALWWQMAMVKMISEQAAHT